MSPTIRRLLVAGAFLYLVLVWWVLLTAACINYPSEIDITVKHCIVEGKLQDDECTPVDSL